MKLRPIIVFAVIAALFIGFIYWREHVTPPAKARERRAVIAKTSPKISRKKAVVAPKPVVAVVTAPAPTIVKARKRAKVAIVIDDFGYSMNNVEALLDIGEPFTLSILPKQRYSHEVANLARSRGYEVMLHLPLEAQRKDVKEESDTIRSGMSENEVITRLKRDIADVPGIDGVSNHQGSKATEDKALMAEILQYLKKNKLYFFDSLTSQNSVCREVASEVDIRYARRDIFLDNTSDVAAIEKQLAELKKMAFARGKAIAVCHDRKNTAAALSRMMPEMSAEGIEFVYLSDMEK